MLDMALSSESLKQSTLDDLLVQSEQELQQKKKGEEKKYAEQTNQEILISETQTQAALAIERDILATELNNTQKLESGLWIGAHIVCLPFFYDEYTIRARLTSDVQKKYNQAIIATCGRFKAMGKKGIALVSPITNYIRNYTDFSISERKELEDELIERVFQWLKGDVSFDFQPRMKASHSLEVIMADIENAERIFERANDKNIYMEGEVRLAVIQAIRHTDFLPSIVKYQLLNDLKTLNKEQIFDIGTFLLWEIRKSGAHHNKLLYYMLRIFKRLSDTIIDGSR